MEASPNADAPSKPETVSNGVSSKKASQKVTKKSLKRRKEETDGDDSESDLEDFIVKDKRYRKMKGEEIPSDSEDEESVEEAPALPEDGPELAKVLQEEAEEIAKNLKSQVVGGRALRDRNALKKPQDSYWEKQGKADYQKLMEKDRKKDLLDEIRMLKRDITKHPEDFDVALPDDFQWPTLSMRNSLAEVEAGHRQVCEALGLDASDSDDDSEDEKSIHTTDSEEYETDAESEEETEESEEEDEESLDSEDSDESEED